MRIVRNLRGPRPVAFGHWLKRAQMRTTGRPMVLHAAAPTRGLSRLAKVVRLAPESAAQAMDGMDALGMEWMSNITGALSSDAFKGLVGAGTTFYAAQQDRRAAQRESGAATRLASLESKRAQAEIDSLLATQKLATERANAEAAAGRAGSMAIPATVAVVGVLGLVAFIVLKNKKRK